MLKNGSFQKSIRNGPDSTSFFFPQKYLNLFIQEHQLLHGIGIHNRVFDWSILKCKNERRFTPEKN